MQAINSPARQVVEDPSNPSAKTFAENVALTQKRLRAAYKLQAQFLDPSKTPRDGKVYSASIIRSIFSDVVKSMDFLTKQYRNAKKKKKSGTRVLNLNSGIRKPVQVNQGMLNFLAAADFGPVSRAVEQTTVDGFGKTHKGYVSVEELVNGRPVDLKAQLPVLTQNSIASPTTLNALFNVYISRHGLAHADDGSLFSADNLMLTHFNQIFTQIKTDSNNLIPNGLQDGSRKGPYTKKGLVRTYYTSRDVKSRDPQTGRIVHTKVLTTKEKYHDFYHVITPEKFPRVNINSIIKYSKVLPQTAAEKTASDNMYKLNDDEQTTYRDAIASAKLLNPVASDYRTYSLQAISALAASGRAGYSQNQVGYNRLVLRGNTDHEEALARQTTKSYSLTKPKKA